MNKVIFFGVCVDNQDPALAGRIRAVLDENWEGKTPVDYDNDVLESLLNPTSGNPELIRKYDSLVDKLKWSEDDPHICPPFLPPFVNIIPQVNENVKIIVYDPSNKTQNKEYIGPTISQPTKYSYQQYAGGRLHTSKGVRVKPTTNISESDISNNTFAYPDKIALSGRDNTDIIFGSSEILLRAGKFVENKTNPEFPVYNPQMSTIQITNYPSKLSLEEKEITKEIVEEVGIKYLVEYEIYDLNPTFGFTGKIALYEILSTPPFVSLPSSGGMGLTTPINNTKSRVELQFTTLPLSGVTDLINEFLSQVDCRGGFSLKTGPFQQPLTTLTPQWIKEAGLGDDIIDINTTASNDEALNLYPFYFRPSLAFQDTLTFVSPSESATVTEIKNRNAQTLTNNIRLLGVNGNKNYGLKISRDQSAPEITQETTIIDNARLDDSRREGIINAISNKILLYSHDSTILDKEKRNPFIDNKNQGQAGDNMGLDQKTQITLNDKEMEPLVRGDQLVDLLTEIVIFLLNHTHKEPGTTPVESELEMGQKILTLLQEKNFLNQNIRIN